jgi:phosphatidylglycerophosphate synthase
MSVVSPTLRNRVRSSIEMPVARFFGRLGFTPNSLTLIGFAIAVVGAWLAATQAWLLAGLVVAFGAIFDLFDGALARATNRTSNFGAFLDSTMDRAGEAVVYIGIASVFAASGWTVAAIVAMTAMAAAQMVSYTRAKSESLGFSSGSGMANIGLAPREVRTSILVIGLIAAGLLPEPPTLLCIFPCPQPLGPAWLVLAALGLIAVLSTITTIQRILFTYNQSRSSKQEVNH